MRDRIIPALDLPTVQEVEQYLNIFHDADIVKTDYAWWDLLAKYPDRKFFVDDKYEDIPRTVSRKVTRLTMFPNVKMCTVHAEKSMMAAAVKAAEGTDLKILSVLLLTSMGGPELRDYYNWHWQGNPLDFMLPRLEWAIKAGCHGTICSAQEVAAFRERVPEDFLIVVPGTRADKVSHQDHKRTGSSRKAIEDGATHIVCATGIIDDPDPAAAFERKVLEISLKTK